MLFSLSITVFLLCYTASGFNWRNGCHIFGWSFFLPVAVAGAALVSRYLDMQGALVFLSAKVGQSQALSSLWGAVFGVAAFWVYVAGTRSGYLVE
mmetsp:Transcript_30183/g.77514  ORF Transcript_30183/g.77514 Transcript_30183/m.77514 type:complete len:95 (-) Transcript_30183:296-580(-)|eukprot:jgi/Tetstr1/465909/TSEL_010525.t1